MKNALLAIPLLAAGVLAAGCAASSTSPAVPAGSSSGASGAAAAAGTGAGGTVLAVGSGSASSRALPCTSNHLKVSLGGGDGAGMSQNHTGLQLRNVGLSACTLYGYPGVSWVAGANGHQVGPAAARQRNASGSAEKTVTLAPGALASAPLDIVDAGVFDRATCKPVPVRGLRVYPPGEKAALFLPLPTTKGEYGECSGVTPDAALAIGYVQPGVQPGGGGLG